MLVHVACTCDAEECGWSCHGQGRLIHTTECCCTPDCGCSGLTYSPHALHALGCCHPVWCEHGQCEHGVGHDGVCVVARTEAIEVLTKAQSRTASEQQVRQRMQAGELGLDIYDMRQRLADAGLKYV